MGRTFFGCAALQAAQREAFLPERPGEIEVAPSEELRDDDAEQDELEDDDGEERDDTRFRPDGRYPLDDKPPTN